MNAEAADDRFQSAIQELRRRLNRSRLLCLPALLAVLAYLGLLVSYWSGLVGKEWAVNAAMLLLAATWISLIPAAVGMWQVAVWRCPACGESALPPLIRQRSRPVRWWMFFPVTPRACLACGISF